MTKTETKERMEKLKHWLNDWNYKYFVLNQTDTDEGVRDQLKKELHALENEYPEFITKDSPTQRVGSVLSGKFEKIPHMTPKESLSDVFSFEELEEWEEKIKRILPETNFDYVCELKIDGLNITCVYENGTLLRALTRGNGREGENVTHNVKTIESVPLSLRNIEKNTYTGLVEVSGEVYMSKKTLEEINESLPEDEKFANPRNAAAGTIRQLNPNIAASRNIQAFFYALDVYSIKNYEIETQENLLNFLKEMGLPVNPYNSHCENLEEVKKNISAWEGKKDSLPYEIDGIVIKVNNLRYQKELGSTAKAPRYAVAYKFPAKQATSQILNIILQVGRTGAITPVAELKPTLLAGSMVSRATLHNEDEIIKKDIRIGDTVVIQKAGDVIPEVVQSLSNLRTGKESPFKMPKNCPSCGSVLEKKPDEAAHRCVNIHCCAMNKEKINHFVSKYAFNIEGLGTKIIDQLIENDLIKDSADIFGLSKEDFLKLPLFQEKRAENIFQSIQNAMYCEIPRFIFALGIRYVGAETADIVSRHLSLHRKKVTVKHFKPKKESLQTSLFTEEENDFEYETKEIAKISDFIQKMESFTIQDLEKMNGIGIKVAESIHAWFRNEKNREFLQRLQKNGVHLLMGAEKHITQNLQNLTFVLTGTLQKMGREEAKQAIKDRGGKISENVTKKTDFIVAGENPGSKLEKAKELGVPVLDEEKILEKLEIF